MRLLREAVNNVSYENETSGEGQRLYIQGIFMQSDLVNENGRLYPQEIMAKAVRDYSEKMIDSGRAIGELNHPDTPQLNFERACIKTVELIQDGSNFIGKALVLSTPLGNLVQALIRDGVKIGVSSRGLASVKKRDGVEVVEEDFMICAAADVVSDPSAPDAFVQGIMENAEWVVENGIFTAKKLEIVRETVKATKKTHLTEVYKKIAREFLGKI